MLCKYGKQMHDFWDVFIFLYFGGIFNKTIIPFALIGFFYQDQLIDQKKMGGPPPGRGFDLVLNLLLQSKPSHLSLQVEYNRANEIATTASYMDNRTLQNNQSIDDGSDYFNGKEVLT